MDGGFLTLTAVIDTGFTDYLTLPTSTVQRLGLIRKTTKPALLAGEQTIDMECFYGMVELDGERFQIDVYQIEGHPLVGMALLAGCRLSLHIMDGGEVVIEKA